MFYKESSNLIFQHLIDLPNCNCVFCFTRDKTTGKTKQFLLFNEQDLIYYRDGVKEEWQELVDEVESNTIRQGFKTAIIERQTPCFAA